MTAAFESVESKLTPQAKHLATFGEAWLASGATSVEIRQDGECLWRRGVAGKGGGSTLSAVGRLPGVPSLVVHVHGISSETAQARLNFEVEVLAENMRLEQELQEMTAELIDTRDQLLAVFGLARATRTHLRVEEVLSQLVTEVYRLTGAELAFTRVPDGGEGTRLVCFPTPKHVWRSTLEDASKWTMQSGTLLVTDSTADRPSDLDLPPFARNIVAVPVYIEGQPVAVLGVLNQRETRFSAGTVKLLQALGEQAGGLLESAAVHERDLARERLLREMELASVIQNALLPPTALVVPGIQLVGRFRPAAAVGGDFYDYRLRPDGHLAFCVGDVSGKGWAAALVMTMTLALVRNASQFLDRPASVMGRANGELYDDLSRINSFVTAFIGFYDFAAGRLLYASAGHAPVIYRASGRRSRMVRATGLPLGVQQTSTPRGQGLRLGPGDLLVVATDGFTEATNPAGELFGYRRLLELVDSVAATPATDAAERMFQAITDFAAGQPQEDDQTLLIVKGG